MSFADTLRKELQALPIKHPCCRKSMLCGLLLCAEIGGNGKTVSVCYRNKEGADAARELLQLQYGKTAEVSVFGGCGHRYWNLSLESNGLFHLVASLNEGCSERSEFVRFACDGCRPAFLRGAFLACGTMNDPHKSFHLEFKCINACRADLLGEILTESGYPPKRTSRGETVGLYYKDSGVVEELISLTGASNILFEIINSRIERDIRNNENRATNCVARNIEKTISAAVRQMDAINLLTESGKLATLPENLQITAMQRYQNPDVSLDELAALHDPPISRSGLNHRLQKIVEAADEIAERRKNTV